MTKIRLSGMLFLAAFLAYGIGASIGSVPLMLLNSAIVIGIGALLFPTIAAHDRRVAIIYLVARIWEGVLLGVGAVLGGTTGEMLYQAGMAGLGIGSIVFCLVLLRAGLVPAFLAIWGLIGYGIFAIGALLELFGVAGIGLWCSIPGGLFEVFFGVWLVVRGLRTRARTKPTSEAVTTAPSGRAG